MSQHLTRKELKQDNVALKVEETTHFLVTHRALAIKVGVAVVAVVVIGLTSWFFISSRRDAREQALTAALALENSTVGVVAGAPPDAVTFPTAEARSAAISKAFNSVVTQDAGSQEAYAAEYYLGGIDLQNGKTDDALKKYDDVAAHADADYASLANLAKAQILFSLGRSSEAEALLKDLIAHPTAMVSKDQASVTLANGIAASQPQEARKLLTPLAGGSTDVSQIASKALSDLPK